MSRSILFYIRTSHDPNLIRRRLNEIAADLDFVTRAGPDAGHGNAAEMLVALAQGELIIMRPQTDQKGE